MTRTSIIAVATVIVALLACKGKGEEQDLPEAPPLPSEKEAVADDARPTDSAKENGSPSPSASSEAKEEGAGDGGVSDKTAGSEKTASSDKDAGAKDDVAKDAGTTAAPGVDASVGDLQKRAQQCINRCSAQFEKCKTVDISKLPECIQKQASCTADCK